MPTIVILLVARLAAGAMARPLGRALRLPESLVLAAFGIARGAYAAWTGGAPPIPGEPVGGRCSRLLAGSGAPGRLGNRAAAA